MQKKDIFSQKVEIFKKNEKCDTVFPLIFYFNSLETTQKLHIRVELFD
jgi:hypothetical protein